MSIRRKLLDPVHRIADSVFVARWAALVVDRPWRVIASVLAIVALAMPGLRLVTVNDDYRIYFSPDNEDLQAWEDLLDTYVRSDGLVVVVETRNQRPVFSPEVMPAIVELTRELWRAPFVTRVDSISNFQHMIPKGDELTVEDLVPADRAASPSFLAQRETIALQEPLIRDAMLSKDGTVTALHLQMMIPKRGNAIADAATGIREIQRRFEGKYPELRLRLGGLVMLNAAFDEYARSDMATILPAMMVIIVVVMAVLFRSALATVVALTVVFLTVSASMGIVGYLGIPLGPHSSVSPQVILTITIATTMHVMLSFLRELRAHNDRATAVSRAVTSNVVPISFTSLTTVLGFASMLTSVIPPFQHIGIISGLGTVMCYVLTLTLLPSLLRVLPFKPAPQDGQWAESKWRWPARLAGFVIAYHRAIVAIAAVVLVPLVWAASQLEIDDHFVRLFKQGTTFRDDADFIDKRMAGTTNIELSLQASGSQGVTDPGFLAKVQDVKQRLLADPMVTHVAVLTDTINRINKNMHGGDEAFYRLPEDKGVAAQYLLFYEMNLPFGLDLNSQINIDKSALRLTATTKSHSTKDTIAFVERTNGWLEKDFPELRARAVSVLVMFSYMAEQVAINFYTSALVAMVLIVCAIALALRSWRMGLLSLVPNLFPIIVVFAVWHWLGRTLDFTAALIFSMTFGVIVDDTVHFLHSYMRLKGKGKSAEEAIRGSMTHVGPAILFATLILALGFMVFGLSNFQVNVTLGLLTALTFCVGFALELMLTPALLMFFESQRQRGPMAASLPRARVEDALYVTEPRPVPADAHRTT